MKTLRLAALGLCALASATTLRAQTTLSDGTYMIDGGSYSITVERDGANLIVIEPNKRSTYEPAPDGSYHFYNPNTDTVYGIRVLDNHRIAAFKPDRPDAGETVLSLVGRAPPRAPRPVETVDIPASTIPAIGSPGDTYGQIANGYRDKAQSDPDNAQTWTACAAAALKRGTANPREADAYAVQMAQVLKLIVVDPARSPCEDAIPPAQWAGAVSKPAKAPTAAELDRIRRAEEAAALTAAERASLDAINAEAAAKAKAATAQILADQQAAAAAKAQYDADKARNDAEVEAARRARAAYDQQMRDYEARYGKPAQ